MAADEQPVMLGIYGHAGRLLARRKRPRIGGGELAGIDGHHCAFVFDVDVDVAYAVSRSEFRTPAQSDGAGDSSGCRIDGSCVRAAAVKREDALRCRVVNDGVGILAGYGFTHRLERLQIENRDFVGSSIAGKAASQFRRKGDSVYARRIGNLSDHGAAVKVQDLNL